MGKAKANEWIKRAGNTAFVTLSDEKNNGFTQILVVRNVKSETQLNKAVAAWRQTIHPSLAGIEVQDVTYFPYEVLKQFVDRVSEIDAPTMTKAAAAGK